jgi:hypothetical protein
MAEITILTCRKINVNGDRLLDSSRVLKAFFRANWTFWRLCVFNDSDARWERFY